MIVLSKEDREFLISLNLKGVLGNTTNIAIMDNYLGERDLLEINSYLIKLLNTKTVNKKTK